MRDLVKAGIAMRATAIVDDDFPALLHKFDSLLGYYEKSMPKIVCLCGSTKFWYDFRNWGLKLTLEGYIVLSIGICSPDSEVFAHDPEHEETKKKLDELHKRKIDLADEIFVLNVGGYIGKSTQSEIQYAIVNNKPVRYLEQI